LIDSSILGRSRSGARYRQNGHDLDGFPRANLCERQFDSRDAAHLFRLLRLLRDKHTPALGQHDAFRPFFAGAQIAVARREGIEGVPTVIPVGDFESLEPEGDRLFRFELDLLCRLRGSFDAQLWGAILMS
jgi:hypothetical protein